MKPRKPMLMAGHAKYQSFRNPKANIQARWDYPLRMCRFLVEDAARRVNDSRKQFPWKFFRGDCHSHTVHSDGVGTVAETAAMVKSAGLDFQFVTDHWGITQAPECRKHGLWVGQEPVTRHHHMGILGLDHAYTPILDFLTDFAEAKRLGATVFLPHPTGWWNRTVYSDEQRKLVEKVPDPFLMEICNGANNIVTAWDFTDDSAVKLWDRLLSMGRVVHAMGNTDAHAPHGIGIVWNGVFAPRCEQKTICRELSQGHSFVSNGPLVHIAMGRARMGDRASGADRRQPLKITAVDSRGLTRVRVVADGRTAATWNLDDEVTFKRALRLPRSARRYVRVEVRSRDGARGYSNPVYF